MKVSKTFFSLVLAVMCIVPSAASAANVSTKDHPAPPLPPGVQVGIASPPPSVAEPVSAPSSFDYAGMAAGLVVGLALGFFIGQKKK